MPEFVQKTIRGLDLALYREARKEALGADKTVGQWINEAIAEKLVHKPKK